MHKKYVRQRILFSKLITKLGVGLFLVSTTSCVKFEDRYGMDRLTTGTISQADKQDAQTVEKSQNPCFRQLIGIQPPKHPDGLVVNEFFSYIHDYREKLAKLYQSNPKLYNESFTEFIENNIKKDGNNTLFIIAGGRCTLEWALEKIYLHNQNERELLDILIKFYERYYDDERIHGVLKSAIRYIVAIAQRDYVNFDNYFIKRFLDLGGDSYKADNKKGYKEALLPMTVETAFSRGRELNLFYELLDRKADVSSKDHNGNNLIHLGAPYLAMSYYNNDTDNHLPTIFNILVREGVNINEKNSDGKTPWDLVNDSETSLIPANCQQKALKLLKELGAVPKPNPNLKLNFLRCCC